MILELSRYLKLTEVRVNGAPVEFIQNEAISGSDLSRRGDDLIGVVMPAPLEKDHPVKLSFKYSGPVMFNAGGDVIYVGARGTWYPNVGPTFTILISPLNVPSDWPVVGTGKQVSSTVAEGKRTTRFVTRQANRPRRLQPGQVRCRIGCRRRSGDPRLWRQDRGAIAGGS